MKGPEVARGPKAVAKFLRDQGELNRGIAYWLGNALYALRDYKGSTATWQNVVKNYPQHPRAPEALLAIANNQLEQGQKAAARKTLQQIVAQYGNSDVAQTAQNKLSQIK